MYTVNFKYKQDDLVMVNFDNEKTIGIIDNFRFDSHSNKNNCCPLYKVSNVPMYVPENIITELTQEQKIKYKELFNKCVGMKNKAEENYKNIVNEIFK